MDSLAHRGLWAEPEQRNTLSALRGAFARGYGVELDVRDRDGTLVVSHDPAGDRAVALADVVGTYLEHGCPGSLAINIKADGLAPMLERALSAVPAARWFAFDMSVPDLLAYAQARLPFFTRHSDIEPEPALYAQAGGVWLDDFSGTFVAEQRVAAHLRAGKRVAVVSPELHRRERAATWESWRTWAVWRSTQVMLCTDHPAEAQTVFA